MKASEAYLEYCALKAHFERPSYSYHKYNGKVKAANYETRKDKSFFFRLSRAYNKKQLHEYYLANLLADNKWVGAMNKDTWLDWKKKIVRLPEIYSTDLDAISQLIKERGLKTQDVFRCESGQHPIVFRLLLGEYIQIESFVILDILTNLVSRYDKTLADDIIWNEWKTKIQKYEPFLKQYLGDRNSFTEVTKIKLLNTIDS